MPNTRLGQVCCGLGLGSLVAFGAFFGLVAAGERGGDTFFSNPWLTAAILLAAGLAMAGAVAGLGARFRQAERGWSVLLFVLFGLLVAIFAAGELLFPH